MAEIGADERVELVEVAGVLLDTFNTTNRDGIYIQRVLSTWAAQDGVSYSSVDSPGKPFREMSATAYAAEFYKVAEGSLDTADFDEVFPRLVYVGNVLGGIISRDMDVEGLKVLARGEDR